jgi:hypothetical protein
MDNRSENLNFSQIIDALDRSIKEREILKEQQTSSPSPLIAFLPNLMKGSFFQIGDKVKQGQDIVKSAWGNIQKEAKENPWAFMGKVAVCSFAIGYLMGLGRENSKARGRK